jgi:signal transduction histidine kinase
VDVRIAVADGRLEITVENPVTGPAPSRPGGGHGLRGIADRARLLGGTSTAGPTAAQTWRLHVHLPMKGPA